MIKQEQKVKIQFLLFSHAYCATAKTADGLCCYKWGAVAPAAPPLLVLLFASEPNLGLELIHKNITLLSNLNE